MTFSHPRHRALVFAVLATTIISCSTTTQRTAQSAHHANVPGRDRTRAKVVKPQPTPTPQGESSECAEANALFNSLGNVDTSDLAAVKEKHAHASVVMAECARQLLDTGHTRPAIAMMAASLHAGNVVAMTMHMEGDDASAATLIARIRSKEVYYLHIAEQQGYTESVRVLHTASDETDTIAAKI